MSSDYVFAIVAHSDDQILGPGGTLAKYVQEGKKVFTIIFSYGEMSHPLFKKEVISAMRVKEAQQADNIIGGSGVVFLGLDEGKFPAQAKEKHIKEKLQEFMLDYRPKKIFTHSNTESHPDHQAVNELVLESYDELATQKHFTTDIFSFALYSVGWKRKLEPKLVEDISKTFKTKLQALKAFKSQHTIPLWFLWLKWAVYYNAFMKGFKHHVRFAEEFFKLR